MPVHPEAPPTAAATELELVTILRETFAVHPLPPGARVTIGRAEDNDVTIAHPSVSRHHAVLHLGPPLLLEDLGGPNGTFLSKAADHRLDTPRSESTAPLGKLSGSSAEIALGDAITLGTVLVMVRRVVAPARAEARGAVIKVPAMRALYEQAALAARGIISVLLLGETGVGKEVLARAIHDRSPRAKGPFLGLNCAALSESLLESELFGHEKGAFTGALQSRPGLFEAAEGGTVFLDEIGELPPAVQVKLLRVIEERQVLRVGGRTPRAIDVRFLSATNRDLEAEAARGAFRQDLYFRLDGITLRIPPLRQRVAEIADLARLFLDRAAAQLDLTRPLGLSDEALAVLERHDWPGNVRELRNVIERAAVLCGGNTIVPLHFPAGLGGPKAASVPVPVSPRRDGSERGRAAAHPRGAGGVPRTTRPMRRRGSGSRGRR